MSILTLTIMMNITLSEIEIKGIADYFHGNIEKETIAMLVNKAETIMAENGLKQEDCLVNAFNYGGHDYTNWHDLDEFIDYGIESLDPMPGGVSMYYNPIIWLAEQSKLDLDELEEKYYPIEDEDED